MGKDTFQNLEFSLEDQLGGLIPLVREFVGEDIFDAVIRSGGVIGICVEEDREKEKFSDIKFWIRKTDREIENLIRKARAYVNQGIEDGSLRGTMFIFPLRKKARGRTMEVDVGCMVIKSEWGREMVDELFNKLEDKIFKGRRAVIRSNRKMKI